MTGNGKLNLRDARMATPGILTLSAKAAAVQEAVANAVTPEVVASMMDAIIKKAKSGDLAAAKFVLDYSGCAPAKVQLSVGMRGRQPAAEPPSGPLIRQEPEATGPSVGELKRMIARYLGKNGPTGSEELAELFEFSPTDAPFVLGPPEFQHGKDGWQITTEGRRRFVNGGPGE